MSSASDIIQKVDSSILRMNDAYINLLKKSNISQVINSENIPIDLLAENIIHSCHNLLDIIHILRMRILISEETDEKSNSKQYF